MFKKGHVLLPVMHVPETGIAKVSLLGHFVCCFTRNSVVSDFETVTANWKHGSRRDFKREGLQWSSKLFAKPTISKM